MPSIPNERGLTAAPSRRDQVALHVDDTDRLSRMPFAAKRICNAPLAYSRCRAPVNRHAHAPAVTVIDGAGRPAPLPAREAWCRLVRRRSAGERQPRYLFKQFLRYQSLISPPVVTQASWRDFM